ncbi:MAG TPA: hypothetical protein VHE30_25920 [Polyangiaceae bacterium]|nr:hypothetical protein [Polyangiaceae bacterium]
MSEPLVILRADELRDLVSAELRAALDELPTRAEEPALYDRAGIAKKLCTSVANVDKLCNAGMPFSRLGDVKRFDLADVVAWVKSQPKELAK